MPGFPLPPRPQAQTVPFQRDWTLDLGATGATATPTFPSFTLTQESSIYPLLGSVDENVGEIVGCEFWMDREQLRRWAHTRWTVDVVPGRGASFSLEAPLNMRFLIRSSMCAIS